MGYSNPRLIRRLWEMGHLSEISDVIEYPSFHVHVRLARCLYSYNQAYSAGLQETLKIGMIHV